MSDARLDRLRAAALPAARRVAYLGGRATATQRVLPNLLICGAQRCGTTSMYQALRQHPNALRPVGRKGVHYFDDTTYENGLGWYRAHFPLALTTRRVARRTGQPSLVFESSPYYLFHPAAASRIAADLPGVRAIVLVRDPVERAYSAHAHESARGYELESFERAVDLEASRLAGEVERLGADPSYASHAHRHQSYLTRGRYLEQITRLTDALGRDRVLVLDADDFFLDPEPVWAQVSAFSGLSAMRPQFDRHNARPRSSMPEPLRARLRSQFDNSDADLARWWGRTPSWRR